MLKMMQFVFPIVVQIQMDVIKNYGFSEGREGIGFKCTSISVIKINYNAVFIIIYSFSFICRYSSICAITQSSRKGRS